MKVLVVDDFEDMRELLEFTLTHELACSVTLATSGNQAMKVVQSEGPFDLIISDVQMPDGTGLDFYRFCEKEKIKCPFVLLSANHDLHRSELESKSVILMHKPFEISTFVQTISGILQQSIAPTDHYVPVALTLLKKMRSIEIPLYVRLNESRYIKLNPGATYFENEDYEKYHKKGLKYLYIESQAADTFIAAYRKKILSLDAWTSASSETQELISLNTELLKNMAEFLGWESSTVELARQSILKALDLAKSKSNLQSILNQFHKIERFGFADHCTVSLLISTGLAKSMSYTDEMTLAQLTFASVLHDMTLTDLQYQAKPKLLKRLEKGERGTRDLETIWEHPAKAAELCRTWDFCPPGVDMIIENHHELPDGHGFPNQKKSVELDFLSCLFILAEDLTNYTMQSYGRPDLTAFVLDREKTYQTGHYRSCFRMLRETILRKDHPSAPSSP